MDQQASIEMLKKMLEIYSPSGKEKDISAFLRDELERLSLEKVWTDKVENVYGEIGSGSPTILICGHIDTVPGWISVKIEGDRLYGRGAADAKSSFAAMISAVSTFKSSMDKGRIVIAGVVDEEGRARGIRQLLREGLKADYAIFGEPSGVKNITFAYKGRLLLKIACKTVSGHVGAQHLLSNAIEKSFELWTHLKAFCEKYNSPLGVFYSLTPCLISMSSRRTSGGVPDNCIMDVDFRLPPTIKCQEGFKIVRDTVDSFKRENHEISVGLKIIDVVEPFVANRDTLVIKALKQAIVDVTGGSAKFLRKTGTGDMNIFGTKTGIPVATYGPGDAKLSHTPNEYISIPEYLTSIQVYKRTIEKILKTEL